tara:strand:- start:189 stop:530 length:342 start_codon:yes stop_codon:yes gene_type:complete
MQKIVLTKGVSSAEELHSEISNYIDVLLGHEKPPIEDGVEALFELSSAYLARAREIEVKLLERERSNSIPTDDNLKRFRTGELRSFIDLCKRAQDQGSRRITIALSELNLRES